MENLGTGTITLLNVNQAASETFSAPSVRANARQEEGEMEATGSCAGRAIGPVLYCEGMRTWHRGLSRRFRHGYRQNSAAKRRSLNSPGNAITLISQARWPDPHASPDAQPSKCTGSQYRGTRPAFEGPQMSPPAWSFRRLASDTRQHVGLRTLALLALPIMPAYLSFGIG